MEILWRAAALACLGLGMAAMLVPRFPGAPVVYAGALLYAWQGHFSRLGWGWVLVLSLLTMAAVMLHLMAAELAGRWADLSAAGAVGVLAGAALGVASLGLAGFAVGPLAGALAGEMLLGLGRRYVRRGMSSLMGFVLGLAGQVGITALMMTLLLFLIF